MCRKKPGCWTSCTSGLGLTHSSKTSPNICSIITYADDTALIVGVSNGDESAYKQEVRAARVHQLHVTDVNGLEEVQTTNLQPKKHPEMRDETSIKEDT